MPAPGDFVVQYRHSPGSRGAARIVVVHAWRSGHGGMVGERPQRIGFASSRAR
jgi:hypothetical protein